jgi:hypothetical protein
MVVLAFFRVTCGQLVPLKAQLQFVQVRWAESSWHRTCKNFA